MHVSFSLRYLYGVADVSYKDFTYNITANRYIYTYICAKKRKAISAVVRPAYYPHSVEPIKSLNNRGN